MNAFMKTLAIALLFCFALPLAALDKADLAEADRLYAEGLDEEGYAFTNGLMSNSLSDKDKAEVLWRQSQFTHEMANIAKGVEGKDKALAMFKEGMALATESIELNPNNPWAYYWRSANMGSWGSTKGIADSLGSLDEMKADLTAALELDKNHGDSWSVLAIINADVPGILGGSIDKAVSQDRRAVASWDGKGDIPLEWYGELANHLIKRDWDASKRNKKLKGKAKSYGKAKDMFAEAEYYEGHVDFSKGTVYSNKPLSNLSDKQEAEAILKWMISNLKAKSELNSYESGKLGGFENKLKQI